MEMMIILRSRFELFERTWIGSLVVLVELAEFTSITRKCEIGYRGFLSTVGGESTLKGENNSLYYHNRSQGVIKYMRQTNSKIIRCIAIVMSGGIIATQ